MINLPREEAKEDYQRGHKGGYQGREIEQRNQGDSNSVKHGDETTPRGGHGRGRWTQQGSKKGRGASKCNS